MRAAEWDGLVRNLAPKETGPRRGLHVERVNEGRGTGETVGDSSARRCRIHVATSRISTSNGQHIDRAECLRLRLATVTDPELQKALRRNEEHILAVAELHRFLAGSADGGKITTEGCFQALCAILGRSALAPLGLNREAYVRGSLVLVFPLSRPN